jgi:hypothetical protein
MGFSPKPLLEKLSKPFLEKAERSTATLVGKPLAHFLQQKVGTQPVERFFTGFHKWAENGILQLCVLCGFNAVIPSALIMMKKETPQYTRENKISSASRVSAQDVDALMAILLNAFVFKKLVAPLFTPARATKITRNLTERFFTSISTLPTDFLIIPFTTTILLHKVVAPALKYFGMNTSPSPSSQQKPEPDKQPGLSLVSQPATTTPPIAEAPALSNSAAGHNALSQNSPNWLVKPSALTSASMRVG